MNRGKAQQDIQRLAAVVRRAEKSGLGRNAGGSQDAARSNFRRALAAVIAVEDAEGVEAVAKLADRLTDLRQRATAVGLITPGEVLDIEKAVTAAGKGQG